MRPNMRQMPKGFAEDARALTQKELIRKYRCGPAVLARWLDEIGFHPGRGARKKPVAQYDVESGEVLNIWPSATAAARGVYGVTGNISRCCLGKYRQAYGYVWKYWTGPPIPAETLRKREILRRLRAFAKTRGRGWGGALAKASGYHLSAADVWRMHEAGKFEMKKWELLARALDKLEGHELCDD